MTYIPEQPGAGTSIMGKSECTAEQLEKFLLLKNPNLRISVPLKSFCEMWIAEGEKEGVRGDIAFIQAIHETNFFRFTGTAKIEWNNPAGIGVTGEPGVGCRFPSWEIGVRAQIQHLKAYASTESLVGECVDPRFKLVTRGIAPNWEDLNGKWSVPGSHYGQTIITKYKEMMKVATHRVYVSASTQGKNVGVGQYGTEQDRMQHLADRVAYYLKTQKGKFEVFRNQHGWSLEKTAKDCNNLACELFIDNHTNAGEEETVVDGKGAEGTEVYYYGPGGKDSNSYKIASILYKHIAPLSPGGDRGVKPDTSLYSSGLYVIRNTKPPACLIEHFFHTNHEEVNDFLKTIDEYAKREAKAICEYFGEKWDEPALTKEQTIKALVKEMVKDGIVTDELYWYGVLIGEIQVNPDYLQIAFRRAVDKIK